MVNSFAFKTCKIGQILNISAKNVFFALCVQMYEVCMAGYTKSYIHAVGQQLSLACSGSIVARAYVKKKLMTLSYSDKKRARPTNVF